MPYCTAIDVGGTKTAVSLISLDGQDIIHVLLSKTVVGLNEFPIFLADLVKQAFKKAHSLNILMDADVLVAIPGNIQGKQKITCSEGSAKQLVRKNEKVPYGAFGEWLNKYFPVNTNLHVMNDAQAQALGAVFSNNSDDWSDKTILYVGPGTGLGGAVIKISSDERGFEFLTDGHIFDILVQDHHQVIMVEDILSGRGVFENLGISAKALNESLSSQMSHHDYMVRMGDVCIKMISAIQSARVEKKFWSWNQVDCQKAAGINQIILGGSIGTKGVLGDYLKTRIQAHGLPVFQAINTIENTMRGLVTFFKSD